MGVEGVGGGVIIAIAAALWLVYLMPTWLRRRQYMATERNAVRLQQTLRILAETAEIPDEVRAEATAKSVAEQHRALRQSARKAESVSRSNDAAASRELSRKRQSKRTTVKDAELREPIKKAAAVSAIAASRLRRTRLMSTVVLVAAIVGAVFGATEVLTTGSWIALVASVVVGFGALGMLQRIATVAAARRATQEVDRTITVAPPVQSFTDWQRSDPERPTWTPVPLPKPLYLSHREDAPGIDFSRVRAEAAAAAEADELLRAALAEPEVTQLSTKREQKAAAPAASESSDGSGYAAMGHIGETSPGITDLNDVLRRRRAV
ncbi:hypothetical protein [Naasia lichenicola]|uniref:Large exoprotein n=1 Tax=Naasia lichenicola TaxID=2565933 RepID=A0A4S4FJQ0_9MICO|nr:hypothetical protein [Naasia lichenicola]THG30144.1 hypothetical protein E6C64_16065 [Naasia lichenicola]